MSHAPHRRSNLLIVVLAGLFFADAGLASSLSLGSFAAGTDGFQGPVTVEDGVARIVNADQKWVVAGRSVTDVEREALALTYRARTTDGVNFAVRLTDATGQQHMQRPPVLADGTWQQFRLEVLAGGTRYESWGGANDKVFHHPVTRLEFVVEGQGTVWVDDVALELADTLLPAFAERAELVRRATRQVLADFEDPKAPVFKGALAVVAEAPATGTGCGRIANPKERWVSATAETGFLKNDLLEFSFRVRTADASMIGVRFADVTGQNFMHRLPIAKDGAWQTVTLRSFAGGESWGGAGDKRWHAPATSVTFVLEQQATVDLDDVTLLLHPDAVVPELEVGVPTEGHIFFGNAPVSFSVLSKSSRVAWRVTDYWKLPVTSGETATDAAHGAVVTPGVTAPGYYLAVLETPDATRHVPFAIVAELSAKRPADTPFGVMTHFAQGMSTDILPLLRKLGVTSVRDEHYWDQVEKKPGTFAYPPRNVEYMQELDKADIAPLIAMTFANKNYDDGLTPHTDAGRAAYGRYGQELLKQWPEQIKWLEIWNEYNGTWCKGPAAEDRPRYYAAMLKAAYEHIKAVRPDVQVLGCATVVIPMPYLEGIFKHGGLQYMDAVVLHPYRGSPEGVDDEVAEVEALIRKYNDGKDKPIWITETGRHDTSEDEWEVGKKLFEKGRRHVASYLVRQYALLMTRNVAKIHWYLCRDYQNFVSMGLLRNVDDPVGKYAVAPAYVAYATLIRQMEGYRFLARVSSGRMTHLLRFDVAGTERWIAWSVQPETLTFAATGPVTVVDMMGGTRTLEPVDGRVALTLDEYPVFVTGLTGLSDKPLLELAVPQTVDLLARFALALRMDADGAVLHTAGQEFPLKRGGNSVVVGEWPASDLIESSGRYEVRVGGRACAVGTMRIGVRDPLVIADASFNVAEGRLVATLRNTSASQTYDVKDQPFPSIAPGESRQVTWPAADAKPFAVVPVDVSVACAGRPAFRFRGQRAWTPWGGGHVLTLSEAGRVWGSTGVSGTCTLDRTEAGLHLRGTLTGLTPRADLVLTTGSDEATWRRSVLPLGPDGTVDVVVPWADIPGVDGTSRSMRCAFGVYADREHPERGVVEWPAGVASGLEPAVFATLLRAGSADLPADAPVAAAPRVWETVSRLADSETDYSKTQGYKGGFYGYYDGKGGGDGDGRDPKGPYSDDDFKGMQHVETMWGYTWSGPYRYMALSAGGWHPAAQDGRAVWAVRRWVSPVAGNVRIVGRFARGDTKGDGSGFKILVDGVVRHSALSGAGLAASVTYDVVVPVQEGSRVDFACTPGIGVNTEYDASTYAFLIEQVR